MPRFRLVASDIDGTLVNDEREVPPYTLRVLRRLLDDGVPVVLVTGQNPWTASRVARQIGHGVRAITMNGAFLLEDGTVHAGDFVDEALAREVAEAVLAQGYAPLVYGEDGVERYIPTPDAEPALASLQAVRHYQPFQAVHSLEALFEARPAVISICETYSRAKAIYPLMQKVVGNRAYVIYQPGPQRSWVEVNHRNARKDTALLTLARRLGVPAAEIVYFGDNLNDLVVFRAVPHSVAVENAHPEVKALAWKIVPSYEQEGVAHFLTAHFALSTLGQPQ